MTIARPEPTSANEARIVRQAEAFAEGNKLYGARYTLPNGEQLMHGSYASLAEARFFIDYHLGKNPEARRTGDVVEMSQGEAEAIIASILKRHPRRLTLAQLTHGQPMLVFTEGWRVPGSKQKPPRSVAAEGWGDLAKW